MNNESDKENGKHYSLFSRNEQLKIDLSIETLQDHDADLKVEHYSLLSLIYKKISCLSVDKEEY